MGCRLDGQSVAMKKARICGLFCCIALPLVGQVELSSGELDGAGIVGPGRRNGMDAAAGRATLHEGAQHEALTASLAIQLHAAVWQRRERHLSAMGCKNKLN